MIWRRLDAQSDRGADSFAWERAGNNKAARIAVMAITTSNSTSVNAVLAQRIRQASGNSDSGQFSTCKEFVRACLQLLADPASFLAASPAFVASRRPKPGP